MATTTDYRATGEQPKYVEINEVVRVRTITPAAAGLNDVWKMFDIPAGATISSLVLDSDDLDSNASPAITLDVGDGSNAARFISQSNAAQGGGVATPNVAGTYGYVVPSGGATIQIKVHAAAATFQSGNVRLKVGYCFDP